MRILIVTTYGFDPAFPSRPEQLQARALLARGHRVIAHEYLDRRYPGQSRRHEWLPGGIPVHRAATLGFFAPEAILRLILADRPDVIHLHHLRSLLGYQTVAFARRLNIPTVLTVHGLLHDGDLVVDRERPLEAPLRTANVLLSGRQLAARLARGAHLRRATRNYLIHAPLLRHNHLIALSQHERELLVDLGVRRRRISVLPNVVELDGYAGESGASIAERAPLVLFIGQLVPRKGFDLLAQAVPLVLRDVPAARFVLVSHNRAGEEELWRILRANGAAAAVELRGRVDEVEKIRLLREAAVTVAPSRYEGFGIPLIEAMAAGTPVVTTDAPAGNEVIAHERTGLLTPYADVAALAAAIVRLLRDRAFAQCLVDAARPQAFERYSPATIAEQLEDVYTALRADM